MVAKDGSADRETLLIRFASLPQAFAFGAMGRGGLAIVATSSRPFLTSSHSGHSGSARSKGRAAPPAANPLLSLSLSFS